MAQKRISSISLTKKAGALPLLSLALLVGCSEPESASTTPTPVVRPALTEVVQAEAGADLSFNGVVRATNRAELAFRTSGRISALPVNEGDRVEENQLLAQLDSREAETALASSQIELNEATQQFNRGKAIFVRSQAISRADLDKLAARLDLAQNVVNEAQLRLEYTELKAPFAGVIGRKLVENFAQVQQNQPILTLQNLSDLEVVINVSSQVVLSGERRTMAFAEITDIPDQRFPLTLKTFASEPDPASQTYAVVLSFDDLNGYPVLPGMTVKVMPVDGDGLGQSVITIPLTAVVPDNQGGQYVWVVNASNQVEKRSLELGEIQGDRILITGNLEPQETVVIAGTRSLSEGMDVRPYTESSRAQ